MSEMKQNISCDMNNIRKDHLEIIEKQEMFRNQLDNIRDNTEIKFVRMQWKNRRD
jgi:hypothetical protein